MTCTVVISKGKRKGENCNKKTSGGDGVCESHQKFVFETCKLLIIKGARKNQTCGKKVYINSVCKTHFLSTIGIPINPYLENEIDVS